AGCGAWWGRLRGLQLQKPQVQLRVPQVTIQPLLMRRRLSRRAALYHPRPAEHASHLAVQVRDRGFEWDAGVRLDSSVSGGIREPRAEGQPHQPAPRELADQPRQAPPAPRVLERKAVQRAFDELTQVVKDLGRRPVAERAHAPRSRARADALDL